MHIVVLADGSYGPVEGATVLWVDDHCNDAETIEEIIRDYHAAEAKGIAEVAFTLGGSKDV